jgi:hypothetical protein
VRRQVHVSFGSGVRKRANEIFEEVRAIEIGSTRVELLLLPDRRVVCPVSRPRMCLRHIDGTGCTARTYFSLFLETA